MGSKYWSVLLWIYDMIKCSVLRSGIFSFVFFCLLLFVWQLTVEEYVSAAHLFASNEWNAKLCYEAAMDSIQIQPIHQFNWYRTSRTFDSINRLEIIGKLIIIFVALFLRCFKISKQRHRWQSITRTINEK